MKKSILLLFSIFIFSGCGSIDTSSSSSTNSIPDDTEDLDNNSDEQSETTILFEGFVSNAFEATIDEIQYEDLEDFNTHEMDKLPEKINEAGFSDSYEVKFDAEIGFKDLWNSMIVYITPVTNRGYQSSSFVGHNGNFSLLLPKKSLDNEYKVRANKRIVIILSNEQETLRLCYNFSATDKAVMSSDKEKPVILSEFTTKITKYGCERSTNSSMFIPATKIENLDEDEKENTFKMNPGNSKITLLETLGKDYLLIESNTKWCWYSDNINESDMCAINYASACQCSIEFDEDNLLYKTTNFKSKYLDILKR